MRCVRSPAHLRPRMRAHKLAFTPQIVIDTNSPAHAESSPHVRRTLDINRESDIHAVAGTLQTPISIHALRKESDPGTLRLTKRSKNFNPHSPCGERHMPPFHIGVAELFQSTLPLRGATSPTRWNPRQSNFNPHSPCGERLHRPYRGRRQPISIHTPLAGSDVTDSLEPSPVQFQSTLPLRGATTPALQRPPATYFNPHSPCGERPNAPLTVGTQTYFNPHSPCGERPFIQSSALRCMKISIHTPLAGSDSAKNGVTFGNV